MSIMDLFEVITKEEFERSGAEGHPGSEPQSEGHSLGTAPDVELTWCEFCKGYYIAEYHFGRSDDESGG